MSAPRVSVILPVFNRAATIRRCVDSVRAQTFTDWELIAVDDASSDDSSAIIAAYGDPRFRILRHETNRGVAAARNTAMREARGEFIAWIDSDDEWLPEKLARQLALLEAAPADFASCNHFMISAGREYLVKILAAHDWQRSLHVECRLGPGTTLIVRRQCIEKVGLIDESLHSHEDWDWCLRLAAHFRFAVAPEPLARIHYGGPRNPRIVAEADRIFREKHLAEFAAFGRAHLRRVLGTHHARVVVAAFSAGEFRLGGRAMVQALKANPLLPPDRYLAFLLAFIDGLTGTSLIAGAERIRTALLR